MNVIAVRLLMFDRISLASPRSPRSSVPTAISSAAGTSTTTTTTTTTSTTTTTTTTTNVSPRSQLAVVAQPLNTSSSSSSTRSTAAAHQHQQHPPQQQHNLNTSNSSVRSALNASAHLDTLSGSQKVSFIRNRIVFWLLRESEIAMTTLCVCFCSQMNATRNRSMSVVSMSSTSSDSMDDGAAPASTPSTTNDGDAQLHRIATSFMRSRSHSIAAPSIASGAMWTSLTTATSTSPPSTTGYYDRLFVFVFRRRNVYAVVLVHFIWPSFILLIVM
jgi:hypothetical protein